MQTEKHTRLDRRAVAGLLTGSAFVLGPAPGFCEKKKPSGGLAGENPNASQDLFTAKFQQGINKRSNRLFGCQTQNNCVSTAAGKNPTQFVAPWDYTVTTQDAEEAWEALKQVVELDTSLKVIEVDDDLMYLHATGTSKVPKDGIDDVEFLMVPSEKIVTTRSASRGNFYVYPYQVPIGDGGYQKKRLQGILGQLGWAELNYDGNGVFSDGCGPNGDKVLLFVAVDYPQAHPSPPPLPALPSSSIYLSRSRPLPTRHVPVPPALVRPRHAAARRAHRMHGMQRRSLAPTSGTNAEDANAAH